MWWQQQQSVQYGGQQSSWQPSQQPAAHPSSQQFNPGAVHSYQQGPSGGQPQQTHYLTSKSNTEQRHNPASMCTSHILRCAYILSCSNWRAPWKNRICSTTMKLRKSLVKPVTWPNISSYSVLQPEIVMQDAFYVVFWTSPDICFVHDDLGWKNRTTLKLQLFSNVTGFTSDFLGRNNRTTYYNRFGELAAVN